MDLVKNGKFLAELRKNKGMTQKDVAQKLGVLPKTVSKWETGHGFPDVSCVSILAEILGVSSDTILMGGFYKRKLKMNKKLRLGVIGAGSFCGCHFPGIEQAKNAEAVAICDLDREKATRRAEQFDVESVYTDYNELLAREDIEAVTLPIPDQIHKEVAIAALKAGKHVLCEKPMALGIDECKEMIKVAKECGKELMIGQNGRYTPSFIKVKELLDEGAIGELFLIETEYARDYSRILGTDGWRKKPEREPIIGGGCHAIDLIRMMAGNPTEVFSYANSKCLTDWPIHDCCVAVMKFPSGVIGRVMNSHGCKRDYTMRSTLYGTKGTIIFDNTTTHISLFQEQITDTEPLGELNQQLVEIKIPVTVNNGNFAAEVTDFCDCILEGKPVPTDGVEGASTVAVCLAIIESFKTGEKVKINYDFGS